MIIIIIIIIITTTTTKKYGLVIWVSLKELTPLEFIDFSFLDRLLDWRSFPPLLKTIWINAENLLNSSYICKLQYNMNDRKSASPKRLGTFYFYYFQRRGVKGLKTQCQTPLILGISVEVYVHAINAFFRLLVLTDL